MITASILFQIFAAFAIALAGGALSAWLARTHEQLCAFISLGAGTLLGVAVCGIAPECLEALPWWQFLLAGASGYFLFAFVTKYVYHVCPACAASHFDEATTHRLAEFATAMMMALSIHCIVDGLALAAGNEETRPVGLSITFAICVHKFPEGLALGALLLGGGFPRGKMLALANAGGGFLYLAAHAVLGEIFRHHKKLVLTNFAAGFGAIAALILYFHLKA